MKKYRLAIVGATGLVGRTVLKVLEEKDLPISEYVLFASAKSAGKKIRFMDRDYIIQGLNELSFDSGFDFAIFCAGGSVSKKYAPIAASKGCIVVDNSSTFRMDKDVPLVIPEVNPEEIKNNHGIIANPNCSTIQAVVALKPLDDKYKIKRIVYSTYQAVSGAGRSGVADLENGIRNYMTDKAYADNFYNNEELFENIPYVLDVTQPSSNFNNSSSLSENHFSYSLEKFDYPIFSNCLPQIDVFMENGYTKEEEKMINETRKILKRPDLKITATAVRVPVFNCHSESINVEIENEFELDEVFRTLSNAPGVIVQDNMLPKNVSFSNKDLDNIKNNSANKITFKYPLAINACGHNEVFVGRIRRDYSVKSGINLWVVADNIRKGAATNAVQIVERLLCS